VSQNKKGGGINITNDPVPVSPKNTIFASMMLSAIVFFLQNYLQFWVMSSRGEYIWEIGNMNKNSLTRIELLSTFSHAMRIHRVISNSDV
jgi:hypothetical protein